MANAPTLDAVVAELAPLAKRYGITALVIIGRDPSTGEVKLYGETAARTDAGIREVVQEKFDLVERPPDAVWNDT